MTDPAAPLPVLVVTGLRAEARIAAGPGVVTVSGGGDVERLAGLLQDSLTAGVRAVVSFGIAGGVSRGLRPGDIIVADAIADAEAIWPADPHWRARFLRTLPSACRGTLAGSDRAVSSLAAKASLQHRHGAVAVDMESHIAARFAAAHSLPFVAVRVVADPAHRSLPESALVGMRPDGSTDVLAVLRALARRPGDCPALVRTALDARRAFASLERVRQALAAALGASDSPGAETSRDIETAQDFTLTAGFALADTRSDGA